MVKSHRKAFGKNRMLSKTVGFGNELKTSKSPAIDRSDVFDTPSVVWFM